MRLGSAAIKRIELTLGPGGWGQILPLALLPLPGSASWVYLFVLRPHFPWAIPSQLVSECCRDSVAGRHSCRGRHSSPWTVLAGELLLPGLTFLLTVLASGTPPIPEAVGGGKGKWTLALLTTKHKRENTRRSKYELTLRYWKVSFKSIAGYQWHKENQIYKRKRRECLQIDPHIHCHLDLL